MIELFINCYKDYKETNLSIIPAIMVYVRNECIEIATQGINIHLHGWENSMQNG